MGNTKRNQISLQRLKELVYYSDGFLYWNRKTGRSSAGAKLGSPNSCGYLLAKIDKQSYMVHRLIFMYHYGYLPLVLDHVNGDHLDNRIENLREATFTQNSMNRPGWSTSGFKGVSKHNQTGKWQARIKVNGKDKYLGLFEHPEDAHQAYREACSEIHGEFMNLKLSTKSIRID